jgi:hypothetical protein
VLSVVPQLDRAGKREFRRLRLAPKSAVKPGVIRDSIEWIVWQFPPGSKARRSRDGAPGKTIDFFLTDGRAPATVFQNWRQGRLAVSCGPGWRLRFHAKRKGGQAIENKQVCEIVHFAPPMISKAYDAARETVRFARRKKSSAFAGFFASSRAKAQGSEINGGFGARAEDVDAVPPNRSPRARSLVSGRRSFNPKSPFKIGPMKGYQHCLSLRMAAHRFH